MNKHSHNSKYRIDIDGLRALAILPVVIFHAFPHWLPGGFVGVDIFFVISGFLISTIIFREIQDNEFSFLDFYSRRVRRLFPALTLVMVASLVFGWLALDADEYKMLGKHIAAGAGFVQNFVLWGEVGYFDINSDLKPMLHLWSLAIEEQFYFIFPLVVFIAWRMGVNLFVLVLVIGLASLIANLAWVRSDPNATFYLLHTRAWELMAGALLAAVSINSASSDSNGWQPNTEPADDQRQKSLLSFLGFVLILLSIFLIEKTDNFPGWRAILPVLGATLIIYAGQNAWINRHVLSNKLLVFIGLISYPLYLWHWPLLSFARIIEAETLTMSLTLSLVAMSFVLATLTYYLVEKPIRSGLMVTHRRWTLILVVTMTTIALAGYKVYQRDLTSRLGASAVEFKEWERLLPTYEDNCAQFFPEWNDRRDSFKCLFMQNRKPEVVVIGDSHARRIHFGISRFLKEEHNSGLFPNGCAMPFYDISVGVPARARTGENAFRRTQQTNRALDFSINDPAVKVVVLSTAACWTDIVDLKNPEDGNFSRVVERKMRFTFARLSESGKQIIYVLDNPILNFDPKSCVTRPFRINSDQAACKMDRSVYDQQRVEYFQIARRVLSEFPQIDVFDVATKLCDAEYCYAVVDDKLMYHDSSHLGYEGSKYVGQYLLPFIENGLRKND